MSQKTLHLIKVYDVNDRFFWLKTDQFSTSRSWSFGCLLKRLFVFTPMTVYFGSVSLFSVTSTVINQFWLLIWTVFLLHFTFVKISTIWLLKILFNNIRVHTDPRNDFIFVQFRLFNLWSFRTKLVIFGFNGLVVGHLCLFNHDFILWIS